MVEQGTEFRAATVDPHDGEIIKEEKKEAKGGMKKVVSGFFLQETIFPEIFSFQRRWIQRRILLIRKVASGDSSRVSAEVSSEPQYFFKKKNVF